MIAFDGIIKIVTIFLPVISLLLAVISFFLIQFFKKVGDFEITLTDIRLWIAEQRTTTEVIKKDFYDVKKKVDEVRDVQLRCESCRT